ncbi:unnamed protein product [Callosobruchus maculatus]|nr:unnamed protein product [Callosobruchus maculatus]
MHTADAAPKENQIQTRNAGTGAAPADTAGQIVNQVLQQTEKLVTNLLQGVCNLLSPVLGLVDALRKVVVETAMTIVKALGQILTAILPILSVPFDIVNQVLDVVNATLASVTDIVSINGCGLTSSSINVIDSIVNAITQFY